MNTYILVAEDDLDDQFFLQEALSDVEFTVPVYFVRNGYALLSHLEQCGGVYPTFIILDLNMPKMSGTEVLKHIRSHPRYNHIPVYIMTTSANEYDKFHCMTLGADDFMTKPASYKQMLVLAKKMKQSHFK